MRFGLLFNEIGLGNIRDKIERRRWAGGAYRQLRRAADAIFASDTIDNGTLKAIECASIVFAISGDEEYAARAEELIMSCTTFPELFGSAVSDTYDFGCNTLLTGRQLTLLSISFDLLWNFLSKKHQNHIRDALILPATKHLRTNDRSDSNWQTVHNLGLLSAGLAVADKALFDFALDDPDHGLKRQMARAFRSDGLHWEGSLGYHGFALSNLMLAAEMARHAGVDLFAVGEDAPTIKGMLDAPLDVAFPDMSFPANNDSAGDGLLGMFDHYELGYARYRDPAYGWILNQVDRTSLYALIFGAEDVEALPPKAVSAQLEQTGWVSLKSIEGEEYWGSDGTVAFMDYGPHGDWHGHPDKLGIELFADGLRWIQDPGSPVGYMCQQHWEYFRRTLAHNTVVVDFKDQHFERARDHAAKDLDYTGELLRFSSEGEKRIAAASVGWAYEGVEYRRTLTLTGNVLHDEFSVSSTTMHTYDYILHGRGTVEPVDFAMEKSRLPQTGGGYEYFIGVGHAVPEGSWAVVFRDGGWPDGRFAPTGKQLRLDLEEEAGTELYTGYAPSHLTGVNAPFLLVRRRAKETVFRSTMTVMKQESSG